MNKNDITTVTITDIGVDGEGIGKNNGYTLFVKDAVVGDTVEIKVIKAKKNYGWQRLQYTGWLWMPNVHPKEMTLSLGYFKGDIVYITEE